MTASAKQRGVALVGCGYWGKNVLRTLARMDEVEPLIVCEQTNERREEAERLAPGAELSGNLESVLGRSDIEAVGVATPAGTHASIVRQCLEAGKHVLVEKPLATSTREATALGRLAERERLTLMVGLVFLYSPAVGKLREILSEESFGTLRYLHSLRTSLGPRAREEVNVIWDYAIHDVAIALHLAGEYPKRVSATGAGYLRTGIADFVTYTLCFPSGSIATGHVSWYAPEKRRLVTAVGSRKMAVYDDLSQSAKLVLSSRGFEEAAGTDPHGNEGLRLYDDGETAVEIPPGEPLRLEWEHFFDCIDRAKTPLTDARNSVRVISILEAMDRSAGKNGAPVTPQKAPGRTACARS